MKLTAKRVVGFLISPILMCVVMLLLDQTGAAPLDIGSVGFVIVLLILLAAEGFNLYTIYQKGYYACAVLPELWIGYILYGRCAVPESFASLEVVLLGIALAIKVIQAGGGRLKKSRNELNTGDFFSKYMVVLLVAQILSTSTDVMNTALLE